MCHRVLTVLFAMMFAAVPLKAEQSSSGPRDVGDGAKLLMKKVTLELVDAPIDQACEFLCSLCGLQMQVSKSVACKSVTVRVSNATLAQVLKQVKDSAGAVYRVSDGTLQIMSAEELADVTAGKVKFENLVKHPARPAQVAKPNGTPALEGECGSVVATPPIETTSYVIDGKNYTAQELKKEKPEQWEKIQELLNAKK